MTCPICGENTEVINSRDYDNGCGVKRRRKCLSCGYRFSTIELDEDIVKNNIYLNAPKEEN